MIDGRTRGHCRITQDAHAMLRFLQADKYDVKKGAKRLADCVLWRQQLGIDFVLRRPSPGLPRYLKARVFRMVGFDKEHRPLMMERLAEFCNAENNKALTKEEWLMSYAWTMADMCQRFRESSLRTGKPSWKHSYVADLKGVAYIKAYRMMSFMKMLGKDVETFFPEIAGPIFLVNSPQFMVRPGCTARCLGLFGLFGL